ncbi:hypothetical protein I306_06904 [Cryptococcus gattii EJB2]|uniref:Uncharacterized protein n=1 Tax=Cryptococcus gattii EJB2 TaxID=1296103 RepID=A0ABR5BKE5_9TREE|nr:hypothetical protein I306_06904 [Cryptococcus gattii EJB2]
MRLPKVLKFDEPMILHLQ